MRILLQEMGTAVIEELRSRSISEKLRPEHIIPVFKIPKVNRQKDKLQYLGETGQCASYSAMLQKVYLY